MALSAGAAVAGLAAGYGGERLLLRRRLEVARATVPLGQLAGELTELCGPDDVRLAVECYGPAGAPPVVLVHGFSLTGRVWHEQVAALGERFRLVTYDHPGHGRSSPPASGAYSIDLLADALATVLGEATTGRVVLVGHSMGGMTALACARRHPQLFADRVGALLLLSTAARSSLEDVAFGAGIQLLVRLRTVVEGGARWLGARAERVARAYRASSDLSFVLTRAVGLAASADPRHVDLVEQLVLDTELDTVVALTPVLLDLDEEEVLYDLDVPTVVVVGGGDRLTPTAYARHIAQCNPDVELVELPGVGHATPLEAADTVNAFIVRLSRLAQAPGRRALGAGR